MNIPQLDKRRRSARPERIDIGDDELVRNDLIAQMEGTSERTVNRGDARGAPFTLVGNVKYRPIKRYQACAPPASLSASASSSAPDLGVIPDGVFKEALSPGGYAKGSTRE